MTGPPRALVGALGALLSLGGLVALAGCTDLQRVDVRGPADELRLRAYVDLARTAQERQRGLVGRDALAPDEGLLLLFPLAAEVCIENTFVTFAIDAVFVDGGGQVVALESSIAAGDDVARCHAPVAQVLELPAGAALSVRVGDVLERRP